VRFSSRNPTPSRQPRALRPIALIATVLFAVALAPAAAQARPATGAPAAAAGEREHGRAAQRRSAHFARRGGARLNRHRRHRQPESNPAPAPSPAPQSPSTKAHPSGPKPAPEAPSVPNPTPTPEPAPAATPGGAVLFNGDFDSGFKGWYVQSLSSRATLVSGGAYQGSQSARFEVRAGDVEPDTGSQRSEVSGPTFDEGEDLYIRDAIRVPAANTYSAPWQIVQQLHEEDWGGSPGMAVFLDNNRALRLGAGDGSPTYWQGPNLQSDRWYELIYRVNLSQDPGTGFVEVWLDGARQTLANGQARMYGQTIQAAETYIKAGIYRSKSSTGTSIVEHDAVVVGASYAAVTNG
jgi:hypothetical protein